MKVLVVSDTHGRDSKFEEAFHKEAPIDYLIHCGDVEGREFFIEALAECPCCIVSGNNDFFSDLPREEELVLNGSRILVTHGHYYGVSMDIYGILEEAKARDFRAVCFGHTHKPVIVEKKGILILNPGSLSYPRQEGRKPSYIVLTSMQPGELHAEIKYLDW